MNLDGKNVSISSKTKSASVERENASTENGYAHDSISNPDEKPRNSLGTMENAFEDEYQYAHSEDESARSPHESPVGRTSVGSPSQVFSDGHFEKSPDADAETHGYVVYFFFTILLCLSNLKLNLLFGLMMIWEFKLLEQKF